MTRRTAAVRGAIAALALVVVPVSLRAQDVCAGASNVRRAAGMAGAATQAGAPAAVAAGVVPVARGANMYPGSGSGPIPDITDWQPKARAGSGTELVVQGRNLVPGQLVAQLGGTQLTPSAQSATEIRFKLQDPTPGVPLVVFNKNGQPRTLETSYVVYDAMIAVTRVVPSSFSPGDQVTVCGTNLFNLDLLDAYKDDYSVSVSTPTKTGSFFEVAGPSLYANTGNMQLRVQALNVVVAPAGDRITFTAGGTFVSGVNAAGAGFLFPTSNAGFKTPATATGTMQFRAKNYPTSNRVVGPTVTWSPGGPTVTAAFMNDFWRTVLHVPFTIIPTSPSNQIGGWSGTIGVQGRNLAGATWRIGSMAASGVTVGYEGGPNDGTFALVSIPANAPSGPVCATLNGKTSCTTAPLPVLGAPTITRAPTGTVARFTNLSIEGINLLPAPPVSGLTYDATFGFPGDSHGNEDVPCNRVVKVIEHTANRITFRVGDPAVTTPAQPRTPSGALIDCSVGPNGMPLMIVLWANYGGKGIQLTPPMSLFVKP